MKIKQSPQIASNRLESHLEQKFLSYLCGVEIQKVFATSFCVSAKIQEAFKAPGMSFENFQKTKTRHNLGLLTRLLFFLITQIHSCDDKQATEDGEESDAFLED